MNAKRIYGLDTEEGSAVWSKVRKKIGRRANTRLRATRPNEK